MKNGHREQYEFYCVVSLTLITTALVPSLSSSPEWTALNGDWPKLIKVTLSAALQRWMESPRVRLCNRGQDFFSFHYLHLPEAVQSPHRQHNASFHQVSLSRKKADRELLCSMDARSGVEGCRWEAKQKASQAVSVLTDPLAFSGPNGKKKTTIRIKLSFQ